jgi:hypothetical protein
MCLGTEEGSGSFLKKRTFSVSVGQWSKRPKEQKFFASFFQKRRPSLPPLK